RKILQTIQSMFNNNAEDNTWREDKIIWLYNSSRASILVCAVFHSTVNMAFTADFGDNNCVITWVF
ncbi:MAG: hypothetical protein QM305_04405, partial [Bacteroidota bacterium]|nr:hypothetical protein [Bacteroidota bacterium]